VAARHQISRTTLPSEILLALTRATRFFKCSCTLIEGRVAALIRLASRFNGQAQQDSRLRRPTVTPTS